MLTRLVRNRVVADAIAALLLLAALAVPVHAGPTAAINYLRKHAAPVFGKLGADNVGVALKEAITNKVADEDWKRLVGMIADDTNDEPYEQVVARVKDRLNNALKKSLGDDWQSLGSEVDTFVDMLTTMRNVKQLGKIPEDLYEKGMSGVFNVIRYGGDYRTARNLLTNIHNLDNQAANYVVRVNNAMKLFDDMGELCARADEIGETALMQVRTWLRAAGNKPLQKTDRQWFGLLAEIKLGRQLMELGVPMKKINGIIKGGIYDGKLGADFIVEYGGKNVAVEIKNIDFADLSESKLIRARAYTLVDQITKHAIQLGGAPENIGHVAVVFVGTDPSGQFAIIVEQLLHKSGLGGFSADQIRFIGARNGQKWDDAVQAVLELGDGDPPIARSVLQEALDATQ